MRNMEYLNVPSILSFRHSVIKEFKVYTGSRKGAVELDSSEFDPMAIWKQYIVQKKNICKELMLAFIDDTTLAFFPEKYTYTYRFENGVLQIYNTIHNSWNNFAYGDRNKLVIKQGLTGVGKELSFMQRRAKNRDETCFGALNYAGVNSLSYLKDKKATIAWCNVHYTFQ